MSPLFEFLVDLVTSGLGEVGRKPRPAFPEGGVNASMGALAAFVGVLTDILALELLVITSFGSGLSATDYFDLILASVTVMLVARAGRWAGVRAPSVTRRHLGMLSSGVVRQRLR